MWLRLTAAYLCTLIPICVTLSLITISLLSKKNCSLYVLMASARGNVFTPPRPVGSASEKTSSKARAIKKKTSLAVFPFLNTPRGTAVMQFPRMCPPATTIPGPSLQVWADALLQHRDYAREEGGGGDGGCFFSMSEPGHISHWTSTLSLHYLLSCNTSQHREGVGGGEVMCLDEKALLCNRLKRLSVSLLLGRRINLPRTQHLRRK